MWRVGDKGVRGGWARERGVSVDRGAVDFGKDLRWVRNGRLECGGGSDSLGNILPS